jgi:unsaturated chondroitin disaccharide hydrolase
MILKKRVKGLFRGIVSLWIFGLGAADGVVDWDVELVLSASVEKVDASARWWDGRPAHPRTIESGNEWDLRPVKWWGWTHGFWPGVLWMAVEAGGGEDVRAAAEVATNNMVHFTEKEARDHDLGFMIMGSIGKAYESEPTPERAEQIIRGAEALLPLIDPDVGALFSWPQKARRGEYAPYNSIIDSLLNQELFFRASELSGDPKYRIAAIRHADRILATHIRSDYTSYHLAVFDDVTGVVLKRGTHQGYGAESLWARGQAWGIYGFAMCYRETGLARYRETALKLAEVFMNLLPADKVPYWDFRDPEIPAAPRDASAAAIVAAGLLILAEEVPTEMAGPLVDKAEGLLQALWHRCWSGDANAALLSHSTGNRPRGSEVDVPLIYADYYFLEALLRLQGIRAVQEKHTRSETHKNERL